MEPGIDAEAFRYMCRPVPPATFVEHLYRTGFSAAAYNAEYCDIAAREWSLTEVLGHYLRHGLVERRVAPMTLDPQALIELANLPIAERVFRAALLANLAGYLFVGADHPYGPAIAQNWDTIQQLMRLDARPFFVVGDSHSHQFNIDAVQGAAW